MTEMGIRWTGMHAMSAVLLAGCIGDGGSSISDDGLLGSHRERLSIIPQHPDCPSNVLDSATDLYVSPTGSDTNSGLDIAHPLATLQAANDKIKLDRNRDYRVRVRGGTYHAHRVLWEAVPLNGHTFHIEPYEQEVPVFDGRASGESRTAQPAFFSLQSDDADVTTNIVIRGLTVKYYAGNGFVLGTNENRTQQCAVLADNTISHIGSGQPGASTDNKFVKCVDGHLDRPGCEDGDDGDVWSCLCYGFGSIDLMHSSRNILLNNNIINAENAGDSFGEDWGSEGKIHAFYIAYESQFNIIEGNHVSLNSGTPMKFRDSSNNHIVRNYLERAGRAYFFLDQREASGECQSINNILTDNVATFPYGPVGTTGTLAARMPGDLDPFAVLPDGGCPSKPDAASFIASSSTQLSGKYFQGEVPSLERPLATTSADIDGDGKAEVFVSLYYPELDFSKIVYSSGGSTHLGKVAHTSTTFRATHLASANFGGAGTNVVASFYDEVGAHTQIQNGAMAGGTFKIGNATLHDSSGASVWEVTALAAGQVAGASSSKLFTAFKTAGVQKVFRGDGITPQSGTTVTGVSDGTTLYSSSSWEVTALTTGNVDGGGVKLISGFRWLGSGTPKNRIYIGTGSGADGVTGGGSLYSDATTVIRSLAAGTFDGANRLATAFDNAGDGEVYLSSGSGINFNARSTKLYASGNWAITAVARAELMGTGTGSTGDELLSCFDKTSQTEVWSGDGSTLNGGATNLSRFYQGYWQ